tara:strand:+ start:254 stop:559 length:306 start_codon:yes stop_codon:yes gene_type:complete
MAQKLLKKDEVKLNRVGRASYPWEKWMDGSQWKLKIGEDFTVPVTSFRALVSSTAKRLAVKAATHLEGDHLILQSFTEEAKAAPKKTVKKPAPKKRTTKKK